MKICEIFKSIQGEGSFTGFPCVFVRFTGCNLRCSYCDTKYAYEEGHEMIIDEVLFEIEKKLFTCNMVELTGGEPLFQKEIIDLIDELVDRKYTILIETNGSIPIHPLKDIGMHYDDIHIIMDYKLPSSEMEKYMFIPNIKQLDERDDLKFVIGTKEDYRRACDLLDFRHDPYSIGTLNCNILFSPVYNGKVTLKDLAEWILNDNLSFVRLQTQLHKIIWEPNKRGV